MESIFEYMFSLEYEEAIDFQIIDMALEVCIKDMVYKDMSFDWLKVDNGEYLEDQAEEEAVKIQS